MNNMEKDMCSTNNSDTVAGVATTPDDTSLSKQKHHKSTVVIIILAIVACAGIGFGIFEMVMNGQANQKSGELVQELEQKNEALKQAEEKLGVQIEIEDEAKADDEEEKISEVKVQAARDYIYVGEWGVKIKIPENLVSVSYSFVAGKDVLHVSGAQYDGQQYYPRFLEYVTEHGQGLGDLYRWQKNNRTIKLNTNGDAKELTQDGHFAGTVVYEDEDYYITYAHPQALIGIEKSEIDWEMASTNLIMDMLMNNISSF